MVIFSRLPEKLMSSPLHGLQGQGLEDAPHAGAHDLFAVELAVAALVSGIFLSLCLFLIRRVVAYPHADADLADFQCHRPSSLQASRAAACASLMATDRPLPRLNRSK